MSSAEAVIDSKVAEVPPGTFRHTVLLTAKRFKSSWVDLGKQLVKVHHAGTWQEWGYQSFEGYCFRELRLRKQTVQKLTRSFNFLDKHEPKAMAQEDIVETAPPFEVIEVLADAEDRGALSAQEYRSIRDSIWNPEKPANELKRDLVEQFPKAEAPARSNGQELKRLASMARRLADELAQSKKVPKAVAERAAAVADDVAELAEAKAEA